MPTTLLETNDAIELRHQSTLVEGVCRYLLQVDADLSALTVAGAEQQESLDGTNTMQIRNGVSEQTIDVLKVGACPTRRKRG